MAFGEDPDAKVGSQSIGDPDMEWLLGSSSCAGSARKLGPRRPLEQLVFLFTTHPKQRMHSEMSDTHKVILRRQFSRLLSSGYEMPDLEVMIDRFWSTPSAQRSHAPVFPFCNKSFQRQLLSGAFVKTTDAVLEWVASNFSRSPEMDLPWDGSQDAQTKRLLMLEGMDAIYSYPEVVSDILTIHENPSPALRELTDQLHWNWGKVDTQASSLIELVPTVPAELLKRGKARTKQATLSEAVALAQGDEQHVRRGHHGSG